MFVQVQCVKKRFIKADTKNKNMYLTISIVLFICKQKYKKYRY